MVRRWSLTRWVSGLAIAAMLLRMAVPMLAVGAAHLRGVEVGSLCAVYGVVLEAPAGSSLAGHAHHHAEHAGHEGHAPGSTDAHTGDHCALTALAQLGLSDAPMVAVAAARGHLTASLTPAPRATWGDASATWIARRKQGPPSLA